MKRKITERGISGDATSQSYKPQHESKHVRTEVAFTMSEFPPAAVKQVGGSHGALAS
jgi:hypothetical protein